jgi:hypothetical protein
MLKSAFERIAAVALFERKNSTGAGFAAATVAMAKSNAMLAATFIGASPSLMEGKSRRTPSRSAICYEISVNGPANLPRFGP